MAPSRPRRPERDGAATPGWAASEPEGLSVLPRVDGLAGADADTALTVLYAAHYASLVRIAALLLDDAAAGEEVAQDAYVRVHAAWGRLRDADAALAYLRRTVVNLSRSRLRRRQVAAAVPSDPPDAAASAESGALAQLERRAVVDALRSLPARQRETLVLRYWAGLSEAQIAQSLGVSPGAVKSHASRGVAALRAALADAEAPPGVPARPARRAPIRPQPESRPRPRRSP